MKYLFTLVVISMLFSTGGIESIAKSEDLVTDVEVISIGGEWYVALLTEPIYTLSERAALCERIQDKISSAGGVKANVTIDVGLFFDIRYAKTLTDKEEKANIEQRIKKVFLRRNNEYQGNYQSQEKRSAAV